MRRIISIAAFTALLGAAPAAVALPALPPGVNVRDVLGAPIAVPAGETTTVDLGVPVDVSHNSDGWSVISAGTAVSVTAPAEGGDSIVVPVSAAGYSANLTLVAEGGAALPERPAVPATPAPPAAPGTAGGVAEETSLAEGGTGGPARDDRPTASPAERSGAELIELESTVEGNRIVASMGMVQALKLFNQFKDVSRDGLVLRYLDAEGRVIEGVTRDIDEASRTLTLTYPEGETPDNPFVLELVRDDAAVAVVTLTDPRHPAAAGGEAEEVAVSASAEAADSSTGWLALAGVLALVLAVGVFSLIARLRRSRA